MTVFKSVGVRAMALGALVGMGQVLGCDCNCDPLERMDSGDYILSNFGEDPSDSIEPEDQWLFGRIIHVDREAKVATIRYTREGTTYEVHFTLVQTWPTLEENP